METPICLGLKKKLENRDFRQGFYQQWTADEVAIQIRRLRKQRGMTQAELGAACGMKQSTISRLEQADYSAWTTQTLMRLAEGLDARLEIKFSPANDLPPPPNHV